MYFNTITDSTTNKDTGGDASMDDSVDKGMKIPYKLTTLNILYVYLCYILQQSYYFIML